MRFYLILLILLSLPIALAVNYEYIYENLTKQVPIYKETLVEVKPVYSSKNDSWTEAYDYTTKEIIGYKTEYYDGKRIGVNIADKEYKGYVNVKDNILSQWSVPIGDRNFEEFGRCRDYEIKKGVCEESDI